MFTMPTGALKLISLMGFLQVILGADIVTVNSNGAGVYLPNGGVEVVDGGGAVSGR